MTRPIQEKKVTSEALRKGAGPLAAQLIAFEPGDINRTGERRAKSRQRGQRK